MGYVLSKDSIEADPKRIEALASFPQPKNLTDLRSFMGLANQVSQFGKELATHLGPLRDLMAHKAAFIWTANHTEAFEACRKYLASSRNLGQFAWNLPTRLCTDASKIHGLGYSLEQNFGTAEDPKWRIIHCGSRFLADCETRYAIIELECLGAAWAMLKCQVYLRGLEHFTLLLDHKPLIPILNDFDCNKVTNPRLINMKQRMAGYRFTTDWIAGDRKSVV